MRHRHEADALDSAGLCPRQLDRLAASHVDSEKIERLDLEAVESIEGRRRVVSDAERGDRVGGAEAHPVGHDH